MKILQLLPWADWLALSFFVVAWLVYAVFAKHSSEGHTSVLALTNHYRRLWMMQATARDPRMLDGIITQNLSNTPTFFLLHHVVDLGWLVCLAGHHRQSR